MAATTVAEAERALRQCYDEFAAKSEFPVEEVQRRFIAYLLFPRPAWDLAVAAAIEAEARGDAATLHEGLSKFLACQWCSTNRFDEQGINASGYDWSDYEPVARNAALLGRWDLVERMFPADRALTKTGYPPVKCAANLWVLLAHSEWKHAAAARERAAKYLDAKSPTNVDKAYVGYFLALERGDAAAAYAALKDFLGLYRKSNWGRHLSELLPVVAMALLAVADRYRPGLIGEAEARELLGDAWLALRAAHGRLLADGVRARELEGSLAFLRAA